MDYFLRSSAKWIVAAALPLICLGQAFSIPAIRFEPFNPRPGDAIAAEITTIGCYDFDRVERVDRLISIYLNAGAAPVDPFVGCLRTYTKKIALGTLPADKYTVELVVRDPARPTRDVVDAATAFVVSAANPVGNTPTRIETIDPLVVVKGAFSLNSIENRPTKFRVTDAAGRAVSGAPFEYQVYGRSTGNQDYFCGAFNPRSGCAGLLSGADGIIDLETLGYGADGGSSFQTWAVSLAQPSVSPPTAYVTVGYSDAKRSAQVVPVIEYELLFKSQLSSNYVLSGFFLAASEGDMKTLDAMPTYYQRTFAALFGVREGTANAQPVCRFLKQRPAERRYFHWYTLDVAECAAKRNDPAYIYEGVQFWAFPARADGGCPRDTRGVTRYVYLKDGEAIATRHSQLISMRGLPGKTISTQDYSVDVKDDGVAFCVPD